MKIGKYYKLKHIVGAIVFLTLLYFPIFLHLGSLPLASWDESLFALRALYFHDTGAYMINFNQFEGLMDHMSTKLPFTTCFQVLGLKVFGVNELGIRLPIAFLFLSMAIYTLYFFKKHFYSFLIGVLFILLLITNLNFIGEHMLRTGNQDVPFAMYLVLSTLFFHLYSKHGSWNHLLLFCFFMLAALLTKNILALIIFPGLAAYVIIAEDRRKKVLLNKKTYVGAGIIIAVFTLVLLFYNTKYPGFIQRMWDYELMGRYSNTLERHEGPFSYYFERYFSAGNFGLGYLLFFGITALFDTKISQNKFNLLLLLIFTFLSYLLIISLSATKTEWYDAPLYPLGALISAIGIQHFLTRPKSSSLIKTSFATSLTLFLAFNYYDAVDSVYKQKANHSEQFYGELINEQGSILGKNFTILHSDYFAAVYFEKEKRNRTGNFTIQLTDDLHTISLPKKVVACNSTDKNFIENHTKYKVLFNEHKYCKIYLIEAVQENRIIGDQ